MERLLSRQIPQADDLVRLLDLVKAIAVGVASTKDLAYEIDVSVRQAQYYRRAAVELGLVKGKEGGYGLTYMGERVVAASGNWNKQRDLLQEAALQNPVVRAVYNEVGQSATVSTRAGLADWLANASDLTAVTAKRRLQSVIRWLTDLELVEAQGGAFSVVAG